MRKLEVVTDVPIVSVAGQMVVSKQLIEGSTICFTDLEGTPASFDEYIMDALASAADPNHVPRFAPPAQREEVVPKRRRFVRLRDRLASWIAPWIDDDDEDWD